MTNDELDQQLRSVPVPERDPTYWRAFPETVTQRIAAESTVATGMADVVGAAGAAERGRQRAFRDAPEPRRHGWGGWNWGVAVAAAAVVVLAAVVAWNRAGRQNDEPRGIAGLLRKSPAAVERPARAVEAPAATLSGNELDGQVALRKVYEEVAALFPGRLEAIVLGADGPRLQLSETADVPASPPVFVRVCGPAAGCTTAVSFSGQRVQLPEGEVEVLTSGADEVMLLARGASWDGVWTPGATLMSPAPANSGNAPGGWHLEAGWLAGGRPSRPL